MSEFDSILLRVEVGGNRKLRRLTPDERWCVVAGVWSLAAKSPVRGYLLIAQSVPVEDHDVAEQAGVKLSIARSTLKKMRDLGMLERDDELGAEHVHDWHTHQPEPKPSETKAAWRERKRAERERKAAGHGDVTADVTRDVHAGDAAPVTPLREEKGSKGREEDPPTPPRGGRRRDQDLFEQRLTTWVASEFPDRVLSEALGYARHAISEGRRTRDAVREYVLRSCVPMTEAVA